jgi:hypothetical protein
MEGAAVERTPDFTWGGRPVYRCQECGDRFERVDDLEAVLEHEAGAHAPVAPIPRVSRILGSDGEPLLVTD